MRVPVKLTTGDVEQVSKELDAVVSAGTPLDPRTAYQAAAFYYDNNKDMNQLRDANGKYFSKEMRDLAMSGKTGWVDYVWVNPVNKQLEPKSSYVKKVNDSYFVGVGIYTKK